MKMTHKLILVFSLLAILTTAANSIYFYQTRMDDLDRRTYDHLSTLSTKILGEIEQYVRLMDYALESLTADTDFMEAFHSASRLNDGSDVGEMLAIQNILSRKLYQEPILEPFFRTSIYSENGFFISSRFERAGSVGSMTDEAKETIASLSYLSAVDAQPFRRHLIGPHGDPWTGEFVGVFSAVRSVAWHGQQIGYVEINAYLDDLTDIFMWQNHEGFLVQGIFDNGEQLFRTMGDDIIYTDLNPNGMTHVQADGVERLVVGQYSDYLNMTVYVSQDMSVYNQQADMLIHNYIIVAAAILALTLLCVVTFSLGLTRAIRKLTRRVRTLPVDGILTHSDEVLSATVTSPADRDIHKLEITFNRLMAQLRSSMHSEMTLHEGALQAQLNALQMQINPHFIYNTLNIISAKGMECGSVEITDICAHFAQMLRYATDLRNNSASLGRELENAHCYLQLVKVRYEDQLSYLIDVPEEMHSILMPKLSLQPILENALTHGFAGRSDPRRVSITGTQKNGLLHLTVRDNGNGFSCDALERLTTAFERMEREPSAFSCEGGEHMGLINTYLRLLNASKGKIRMKLSNDNGAVITLTLPIRQENEASCTEF